MRRLQSPRSSRHWLGSCVISPCTGKKERHTSHVEEKAQGEASLCANPSSQESSRPKREFSKFLGKRHKSLLKTWSPIKGPSLFTNITLVISLNLSSEREKSYTNHSTQKDDGVMLGPSISERHMCWAWAQLVKHVASMHESLGLIFNTAKSGCSGTCL